MSSLASAADPMICAVLRSRLLATADELRNLLYRSAYSTIMRESRDCNALILGPDGDAIIASDDIHYSGCLRQFAQVIIEKYPDMAPGDVYITNHPFECGIPHSPDVAFAAPAYDDGVRVGFSTTIAHKPDIGGAAVGSAADAWELIQEGLVLPAMRIERDGVVDSNLLSVMAANVRSPDLFLGDLQAQLGVTRVGADRLLEISTSLGRDALLRTMEGIMAESELALLAHIETWGDRTVVVDGRLDPFGLGADEFVNLRMRLTTSAGRLTVDCTESGDQIAGSLNIVPAHVEMCLYFALIAMVDSRMHFSDGMRKVVEMQFRPGSIMNPTETAAVGASTVVRHRFTDLMLEGLGHFLPGKAFAHSGGSGGAIAISWSGGGEDGTQTSGVQYEVLGTAMGGCNGHDGHNGVAVHDTIAVLTPIEVLETQFPLRVGRFELIEDSGGPGRYRGGLSYRREYQFLQPASVNRRADGGRIASRGVAAGHDGRLGRLLFRRSGTDLRSVPIAGRYSADTGDALVVEGAGGGGFGDPLERDADLVVADYRRGHISKNALEKSYGVQLLAGGVSVDKEATRARRSALRAIDVERSRPPD